MILCECNCGQEIIKKYDWYTPRFIKGHFAKRPEFREKMRVERTGQNNPLYGKPGWSKDKKLGPLSDERKYNISQSHMRERNPMWKGDRVGKIALHEWVRNHLPQPKYCEACNVKLPFDLACVTGIYSRDLSNWQYLCRTCHMKSDGRLDLMHRSRPSPFKGIPSNRIPWNKGRTGVYSKEQLERFRESHRKNKPK